MINSTQEGLLTNVFRMGYIESRLKCSKLASNPAFEYDMYFEVANLRLGRNPDNPRG